SAAFLRFADDQFTPRAGDTLQHALRDLDVFRAQADALRIARDGCLYLARRAVKQKHAALRTGEDDGGVQNGREDVFERKSRAESAGHLEQHAQMMKFAWTRLFGSRCFDAPDDFFDRRAVANVDHVVGIGDAEINSIAGLQFMAENFLSVYKSAVAAAHVLQHQLAFDG